MIPSEQENRAQSASGEDKKVAPGHFTLTVDHLGDYEFRVRFDKPQFDDLMLDEPPPLGGDKAPNASRILAAAVGNCLSASLLFCAKKARVAIEGLHTEVKVNYRRNENGRVRIAGIDVEVTPKLAEADSSKAERCLSIFEDYCVVTQSVREGIPVNVIVRR